MGRQAPLATFVAASDGTFMKRLRIPSSTPTGDLLLYAVQTTSPSQPSATVSFTVNAAPATGGSHQRDRYKSQIERTADLRAHPARDIDRLGHPVVVRLASMDAPAPEAPPPREGGRHFGARRADHCVQRRERNARYRVGRWLVGRLAGRSGWRGCEWRGLLG